MADATPKSYHTDPQLYLYTSLTSGSSHIITATSRLETILKANKIPFQALDVATDEKARMLWGRRAGKRKLPGLVRMGMVVADLDEVEEWNEYGELKDNVGAPAPAPSKPSSSSTPSKPSPRVESSTPSKGSTSAPSSNPEHRLTATMRQAGTEAAQKAGLAKSKARTNPSGAEPSKISPSMLESLDNSGPTGMPPASGTTDAVSAQAPETGNSSVQGKADIVPITSESAAKSTSSLPAGLKGDAHDGKERKVPQHRGSNVEAVSKEVAEQLERKARITEEDEEDGEGEGEVRKTREATAVAEEAVDLPRKKTQKQKAASAEDAEASVAD
ncbi:MAG: hypothetical protein FRX48_06523 [Lasallia pustulata]|uniref:Uncharacterized protein n=1 Tax=Lasallia pustulata TaxID=136370 RepID=A0A5M8PLL9_9LECA|nr:MAG: hypothetical protein FRX48_06523 [Lasallia pustulata]